MPTAALLALMTIDKPIQCGIGLGVVLLGLPVYQLVFTRLARRDVPGDAPGRTEPSPASTTVETA